MKIIIIYLITLVSLILKSSSQSTSISYFRANHYVSDRNISHVLKTQKMFFVIFTLKYCTACYNNEKLIIDTIKYLEQLNVGKVYRCEIADNPQIQNLYKIIRFPYLILIENGVVKHYKSLWLLSKIKHFYETYRNPLTIINQQIDLQQIKNIIFLDKSDHQSIVIFFVLDQQKYQQQIKIFKQYSKHNQDIQTKFILIINKNNIAKLKDSFPQWFIHNSKTSLVVLRFIKKSYYFSVISFDQSGKSFLNELKKSALIGVKEFSQQLYQLSADKLILVCVLDSIYQIQKSQKYLQLLQQILEIYHTDIYLYWVQGSINVEKKKILGFNQKDKAPLIAVFNPLSSEKIFLKSDILFNKKNIVNFIENNIQKQQQFELILNQKFIRLSNKTLRLEQNNYIKPRQQSLIIICLDDIEQNEVRNILYLKNRIYKFFYKNLTVHIVQNHFIFQKKKFKKGIYLIQSNKVIKIESQSFQCNQIQKQLSKYKQFPKYFCIHESQIRQYLFNIVE